MKYHLDRHERHARQITGRDFHVRCVYSWPGRTNANRARARDRSTVTGAHAAHEKTLKRPQHEHALEDAGCLRPGAALRTPGAAYPLGAPAFCGTRVSLAPSPTSPLPLPTSTAPPTHTPQKESGRPMTAQATGSPPKADAARPLVATLEVRVPDAIYTCAHARHQPSVEKARSMG